MVGLIALGLTVVVVVGRIADRFKPKPQKPAGFHYPIAHKGFEGSPWATDYDYFTPSRFSGECQCGTCVTQRELIRSDRMHQQALFEQEFPNLAKFLSR